MSVGRTLIIAVVVLGASLASCAEQGEGERCDPRNRNGDCDTGLVCTPVTELVVEVDEPTNVGLCCPPEGESPSVEACFPGTLEGSGGGEPSPQVDGGGSDASPPEPEAGADAASVSDAGP